VQMRYASEYGKQAEEYQQKDYERKVEHIENTFKVLVADGKQPSPATFLAMSGHSPPSARDSSSHAHDQKLSKDAGADEKGTTEDKSDSKQDTTGQSSAKDWKQKLTPEQRRDLQTRLARLGKENRVQMRYASEYGKQAEEYQQKDYERKVEHVENSFKSFVVSAAGHDGQGGFAMLSAPGLASPAVVGLSSGFGFGLPICLVAAFVLKRRAPAQTALRQPLLVVE